MNKPDLRLAGLRRFATAISVLTILGHTVFGFEQAYAHVLLAMGVAYAAELSLETIEAWARGRQPRCWGGLRNTIDFLLPAHISAMAIAMLLYPNARFMPIVLAVLVAIGSKYILRVSINGGARHFLNPSNTGICAVLLLFPWVGIAPPYQFTENLYGGFDWLLPGVLVCLGSFLNYRFTKKIPLISAWLIGFFLQAVLRNWFLDTPILAGLVPMTGVAFLLFTFYMVTDPATTPIKPKAQIAFGAGVAAMYGFLMTQHIVFGLFFALLPVCCIRGAYIYLSSKVQARAPSNEVAAERI